MSKTDTRSCLTCHKPFKVPHIDPRWTCSDECEAQLEERGRKILAIEPDNEDEDEEESEAEAARSALGVERDISTPFATDHGRDARPLIEAARQLLKAAAILEPPDALIFLSFASTAIDAAILRLAPRDQE